jgi:ADP-ribose pyrophosphatase YjhB (NUDIX family)
VTTKLQRHCARVLQEARRLYWRMFRPLTLGVAAIVINEENRILLVRNSYRSGWHLPGGSVERGESIVQAIQRELFEEMGFRPASEPSEILGVYSNFSDRNYDHVIVFVIRGGKSTESRDKNFEIEAIRAFDLTELPPDVGPGTGRRIQEFMSGSAKNFIW